MHVGRQACPHENPNTQNMSNKVPVRFQGFNRTAVNVSVLLKFYFIPLKLLSVNNVQSSSNLIKMVHSE